MDGAAPLDPPDALMHVQVTSIDDRTLRTLAEGARTLAERLRAAAPASHPVRWVQAIEVVDPVAWLQAQQGSPRLFWSRHDGSHAIAGVGAAYRFEGSNFDVLSAIPANDTTTPTSPADGGLQAILAARFDPARPADPTWAAFPPVALYVPAVELRLRKGQCFLAATVRDPAQRDEVVRLLANAGRVATPTRSPAAAAGDATAQAAPAAADAHERETWRAGIEAMLEQISAHRLRKGVLTRRAVWRTPTPLDPTDLLARLDPVGAAGYGFFIEPKVGHAFVGLSPERLYRRAGRALRSEALAGTTGRGSTSAADAVLGEALLRSRKDRLEHELVCTHIRERLAPLTTDLLAPPEPHLRAAGQVQHLRTAFHAELRGHVRDADLVRALHPTPAVCGLPTDRALAFLRERETFDRGLYCGLVGVVGADGAELTVAIRSALVRGNEIELFAGAGIVDGSDPDAEWDETEQKLRAIGDALEGAHASG